MKYLKQVITVTSWEFSRFFKPKNEALGIVIMLVVSTVFFFGGRYAFSDSDKKLEISVLNNTDVTLTEFLNSHYVLNEIPIDDKANFIGDLGNERDRVLLEAYSDNFILHAYKNTSDINKIKAHLTEYHKQSEMQKIGLSPDELTTVLSPAPVIESFVYTDNSGKRVVLSYFFAGIMLMAVFLSFAYQFTAITGEKQLKITEQIVSAISPQVWMDGKIFGITLTGISSMLIYAVLSIVGGMLFFQFRGLPASGILDYIYLPSIVIYLPFALVGILTWNAILAAIASIITEPNNSGKSSLMMLPLVFVIASFLVTRDPDSGLSIFLSWFPLTSATSMPMRWAITEVGYWQLAGSFILMVLTFYFLRKLAAKIFRVSILITGKEPTFSEVYKLSKQA
ncbi:ABC transporter permease [Parapedobacter tibetensis]|uniref:ABC transporter permease n=1 Tax=Parapedobacter tibetensis TaxID=2972951 RepID=UPI00214D96C0|nr:ABC transporter permease [Parapedobacter tibetensis]